MTTPTMPTATTPACADVDPDGFFRADHEPYWRAADRMRHLAQSACATCPLLDPCRDLGATLGAEGLWGGVFRDRVYAHGLNTVRAVDLLDDDAVERAA